MTIAMPGSYADSLDRTARQTRQSLQVSCAIGKQQVLGELSEVYGECRTEGWDGYGALPVEQDTMRLAYCLIDSLPYGFPMPSIGAEPDGHLTLEWQTGPYRILSVSVDPEGYLHFAGIYGTDRQNGRLTFYSTAPTELIQLVRRL